jgi:hypothetical protein
MFVENIVLIFNFLVEFSIVLGMCVCSNLEGEKLILVINLNIDSNVTKWWLRFSDSIKVMKMQLNMIRSCDNNIILKHIICISHILQLGNQKMTTCKIFI